MVSFMERAKEIYAEAQTATNGLDAAIAGHLSMTVTIQEDTIEVLKERIKKLEKYRHYPLTPHNQ